MTSLAQREKTKAKAYQGYFARILMIPLYNTSG